ncbi:hypothetical protein LZ575_10815 [Antarcticibacterium sp. 1MA-6-2]|uniref:MBG domain-containing protein n=1 Tax=Antarcticibacterium sp. 1MA-6-2 TaxID=2908210 RepID=UPI001F461169|nr:MBG domain-containing protein [Antarcticibacterium sp. 1MA-6-2]UJH92856.1 hypothetical protein LZ575_10815 [Antarcticibacterium sp. 1MA-6-2]
MGTYPGLGGTIGTTSFTTPNHSATVSVNNQSFSYTYPLTVTTLQGVNYIFISSNHSGEIEDTGSGGKNGPKFGVIGYYELACTAPSISSSKQPANQTITYGQDASFTVEASGTVDSYKWQVSKNGGVNYTDVSIETFSGYSGVTSTTLSITKPTVAMSNYRYRVVLSACDPVKTTTSSAAILTVNKKATSVVVDAQTKEYGSADPAFTGTLSGFLSADGVTAAYSRVDGETVAGGPYAISATLTPATVLGNYEITNTPGALSITKKEASVVVANKIKEYGSADPAFTGTLSGFLSADGVTAAYSRVAGETVAGGPYAITAVLSPAAVLANYEITNTAAALSIAERAITITADAMSKTYGEDDPALTYQITEGSLAYSDVFTGDLTRESGDAVGDYEIQQGTVALNSNYTLTYVPADLSIGLRSVEITADAKSKTYGDADPALTYKITDGSLAYSDVFTGDLTRESGDAVGDYEIQQGTVALNSNYTLTYVPADLTIGLRSVEITADAKNKTYGDADPALTYQITEGSLAYSDAFTGDLTRESGDVVGDYEIQQGTVALNSNYTLTYVPADLTIGLRSVEITADAKNKTYGDADPALTYQITEGSLAYSDAFTGDLTRESGDAVGDYEIQQGTVALNSNYTLTYVPADLTIGLRSVEITAEAKNKTYGDADPAFTYQITEGSLAYSDAFTGELTRVTGEDVDSYQIQQGTVTLNSNYSLTYVPADLSIGLRSVEITADAKSIFCGQKDPILTFQITSGNLVYSDTFSGELSKEAGVLAGEYEITQGTVNLSSNYLLIYIPAKLTIQGVTIDASASSNPVQLGTTATLSAQVTLSSSRSKCNIHFIRI